MKLSTRSSIPVFLIFLFLCKNTFKALSDITVQNEWQKFQKLFQKSYSTNEHEHRSSIFKNNLLEILNHNRLYEAGNVSYDLGINKFTDWTHEEFSKYVNKFRPVKLSANVKFHQSTTKDVPDSIDWRYKWAVADVRDQGHCGSCWAFCAVGALEGQARIALKKRIRLSEQNLLDCADEIYGNHGCDGGNSDNAFDYVKDHGIQFADTYFYEGTQRKCRQTSTELYVVDHMFVRPTEEALKQAVATIGPIAVGIEATANLQHYSRGIFYDWSCINNINHGVLLVGYGTDRGQDYWLIKNSWGSYWGERGYFRLARNRSNNCAIASYANFPVVSKTKP